MSKALSRAWLLCLSVTALAVSLTCPSLLIYAEPAAADPQPQLVYQNPHDGDVLQQPAFGIQLCFASPINIKDLAAGGDFTFTITEPDGIGLGNRDVFQSDGYGVTVYPGSPIGDPAGQWQFHYRVTSPDAQSALEGDISYTVDPNGSPFPQETPPVCVESGGTATALPGAGPIDGTSGDSSDILNYALIALGAVGVALSVLIFFFVGRRRGHRLTPGPTSTIASPTSDAGTTFPPVVETSPPLPQWSGPLRPAPPPVVEGEPPLMQSSPPPGSATPPPVAEGSPPLPQWSGPLRPAPPVVGNEAPLAEPSPLPGSTTPPPVAQSGTPSPESSSPPLSETPTEDSGVGESAGYSPDNSRFALLAIAAAVILLIGLIMRRRGRRDTHRGKPGGDDGNHD